MRSTAPRTTAALLAGMALLAASACGAAEAAPPAGGSVEAAVAALGPAREVPAPCDQGFAYGITASFDGAPTSEEALQAWLDGTDDGYGRAPSSAPRTGWTAQPETRDGDRDYVAGEWRARTWRGTKGEWLVISQECWPAEPSSAEGG